MTTTIILTTYKINKQTLALLPAYHTDYQTIVIEEGRTLYVKTPPFELIKLAAKFGGAEYNGRRRAMTFLTGFQKKIPIPINPLKDIYAFPTTSPCQHDCCWIFFRHVNEIKPAKGKHRSVILFKNGFELKRKESHYILNKQMYRTWQCKKALQEEME